MATEFSIQVVLLRLAGMFRINCDICFLYLVVGLVLLAALVIVLVCDRVLWAGALSLTVSLACACRLLRILFFVII